MISMPKPALDIDEYISSIVKERQNGINAALFSSIESDWKLRCHQYEDNGGDGVVIPRWQCATDNKVSFKTLYSDPGEGSQSPYISGLRDRKLQLCPMCGEAGTPNTLDHYLPKNEYPHFAILPQNLVPACDICQGHKKEQIEENGQRLFLHPYYDGCLVSQIIRLQINPPFSSPTPALSCHPDAPPDMADIINTHLSKLELHSRFLKFFKTDYIRLLKLVKRARARGQNVSQKLEDFQEHSSNRALNSWEHVFFEGVLANPDLVAYLESDQLPAHM